MLDEIRSFFEKLRQSSVTTLPQYPLLDGDPLAEQTRKEHEKHTKLMLDALDAYEAKIVEIYEIGTEDAVAIDALDQVMAIIRRRDGLPIEQSREIGLLLRRLGPAKRASN